MSLVNRTGLPISLSLALANNTYSNEGSDCSATELSLSPRIRQLRKRHNVDVDVTSRIYSLLGTLTHKILESSAREMVKDNQANQLAAVTRTLEEWYANDEHEGDLPAALEKAIWEAVKQTVWEDHLLMIEKRMFAKVNGWIVSGQCDSFNANTGVLEDYKLTSVWKYIYNSKEEWEKQLNIYKWLWHENGYEVKEAYVHGIFRDWQKTKADIDPKYPKNQWEVMPINLWPIDQCEAHVKERIKIHQEAEKVEDKLLPLCSDEERWADPEKWAVKKEGGKRAIKLFDSSAQAIDWMARYKKAGEKLLVEHRPSESTRCIHNYCEVRDFCPFGLSLLKAGEK